MKKIFSLVLTVVFTITVFSGCTGENKDADIKEGIEKVLKADPMSAGTSVEVKDGVATISGECMDDKCKEHCAMLVERVPGVKAVVNNCTVLQKTEMTDDAMNKQLYDLSKDLPYIKIGSMNGIVAVAGGMTKKEWETLKAGIDKLRPKGYDTTMLNVQ